VKEDCAPLNISCTSSLVSEELHIPQQR